MELQVGQITTVFCNSCLQSNPVVTLCQGHVGCEVAGMPSVRGHVMGALDAPMAPAWRARCRIPV